MEPTVHVTNHTVSCEVQLQIIYIKRVHVTHFYILELLYCTSVTGWQIETQIHNYPHVS